jgi:4-hydroxy-3-polyprenylbenzoate decarboxylase
MTRLPRRIIVAISGASGAVYGVRLLQVLRDTPGIESHLVVSSAGWRNVQAEHGLQRADIEALAHHVHDIADVGAAIASGSFQCSGHGDSAVLHAHAGRMWRMACPTT